jgi:hypothetical protein
MPFHLGIVGDGFELSTLLSGTSPTDSGQRETELFGCPPPEISRNEGIKVVITEHSHVLNRYPRPLAYAMLLQVQVPA